MLIAHLSDLHVPASRTSTRGPIDLNAALHNGFEALLDIEPRPDLVILTGDVADQGEPEAYARTAALLRRLRRPVIAVPGNHDDDREFAVFLRDLGAESAHPAPSLCCVRDFAALRVIGLASNLPLTSAGGLSDDTLDWLDETLAVGAGRPTLIALHHPPFRCGVGFMDRIRLVDGAARFECIVAAHPNVLAILCGHHHRAMETSFGGRPCYVAPALSYQVGLDLRAGAEGGFTSEAGAFRLLHYDGRRLVSYLAAEDATQAERSPRNSSTSLVGRIGLEPA